MKSMIAASCFPSAPDIPFESAVLTLAYSSPEAGRRVTHGKGPALNDASSQHPPTAHRAGDESPPALHPPAAAIATATAASAGAADTAASATAMTCRPGGSDRCVGSRSSRCSSVMGAQALRCLGPPPSHKGDRGHQAASSDGFLTPWESGCRGIPRPPTPPTEPFSQTDSPTTAKGRWGVTS